MRVRDLTTTNVLVAHTYDSIHKATKIMLEHRFGALPVMNKDEEIVGILSAVDMLKALDLLLNEEKKNKKKK